MTEQLTDKVVVVTGAGKGLGRAYALFLGARGARVVVNNRRHEAEEHSSADRTVAAIREAGGSAVADYSSVEDRSAGENLLRLSLETFGRLDGFIANAGISEARSFHKQDLRDFSRLVEINLLGTVNAMQPAFRHMYAQNTGSIIITSSVAGLYGEHGLPAYSASKAALLGLMYSLSQEGGAHGLRVNALAPFATTSMTSRNMPLELRNRLGPERVAALAAWLISDACSLNGEIIICGGGKIARARMMETAALNLPDDADHDTFTRLCKELEALPTDQTSSNALEQFAKFLSD